MQWENSELTIDGVVTPTKVINFAVDVTDIGGTVFSNSNGLVPLFDAEGALTGETDPFNQPMFDRFDITVDQLEGEINLPYILERRVIENQSSSGDPFIPITRIVVPHSLLGGFTQFRINYQYIHYPGDVVATGEVADEGFVINDSFTTPRTIVPRFTPPPPPPPPPVFTIDEGQIKEALADKIYEKFFNSDEIQADISDVLSLQTTTSEDGVGYGTGRTSEDQQLIIFKKDRNTPENKRDFEGDGSDGIQAISNIISSSLAGTSANGVVDLSDKLDDELSIVRVESDSRISSVDTNYFDPPIPVTSNAPDIPRFYVQITKYTLKYSANFQQIDVDFAELWQYYQQSESDDNGEDPKEPGMTDEWKNKLNLSQLTLVKPSNRIDELKATATLDTNIFELLPNQSQRQLQIDNFFDLFNQLIGTAPGFTDGNNDNVPETITDESDDLTRRITLAPTDAGAFITRANKDIQLGLESDDVDIIQSAENNQGKTLEGMRNRLNDFLLDVDSVVEEVDDSRPEYVNQSSGFLKLRRLNQSILIKGADETPSFGNWTEDGFTITMWVRFLNTTGGGSLFTYGNPMMRTKSSFRLETMTVQEGDLSVNLGGDTGQGDYTFAKSRRVIRLVVWEDGRDHPFWQQKLGTSQMDWASGMPYERRAGFLYDSSVPYDVGAGVWNVSDPIPIYGENDIGIGYEPTNYPLASGFRKLPTWFTQMPADMNRKPDGARTPYSENFLQYTDVPTDDLEEWFFVCATYNPNVNEIGGFGGDFSGTPYGSFPNVHYGNPTEFMADWPFVDQIPGYNNNATNNNTHLKDELFWLNHRNYNGDIVSNIDIGNRCKVEIISRSDLLRARGYRV